MLNFGVQEVANSKATAAPGWAYVPDTGVVNSSATALQPSSRKRAARNHLNLHETSAKQDAKILRELAALDRENHKDVSIPVPIRHRDNAGRVSHGKVTPAVRKILQSQKTFANHLSDYEALSALSSTLPQPSQTAAPSPITQATRASPSTAAPQTTTGKRPHRKKDQSAPSVSTPLRSVSIPSQTPTKTEPGVDAPMPDALVLSRGSSKTPPPHPGDFDPLLISRIPEMPTQAELEKLLTMPPLSYNEAGGKWTKEDRRRPVRVFCEVCGYWGRVRCTRCGGKVCALECLGVHGEECFTRYGA